MRTMMLADTADTLPTREAMRAPYKSRHTAARFTTRNGRRGATNEVGR